ncbi:hypothetical protein ROE7235_03890 [Roseibaca ekhonensis]|uniref:Uncharacterized protein n=1 Tax=Roseinatronobacter ekhonensis TaxID=254356 RepID=A0A3B0MKM4_9RHOB|nr:hypothetical protein [Roseibaca ekhonensis]SUZ34108.1 hypothetical protein ROE7235_03890 [Roseibaca ekhonensis]
MSMTHDNRAARHALIWTAACELGEFTYADLAARAEVSLSTVQNVVKAWLRQERAVELDKGPKRALRFRVVADGQVPAELRADGRKRRAETAQGNCWTAMRRLRSFTPTDIAAHASTDTCEVRRDFAQSYCQMLSRAGYLHVLKKALPGRREATYRLARNSGPLAPVERRVRAVYDPNESQITHVAGGL